LRGGDQVARLGGDEFAILLPGADRAEAIAVTQRVLMDLSRPIEVDGRPLDIGASVGIALFPDHAQDAHSLLQRADAAMYQAKRSRAGWAVFDFDHSHGDPRRLALIADMRRAIEEGQFLLHYQPLIDLKTGHVRGVEALARWVHPTEGMIPPGRFIPLAEHTGLIRPLGLWVLDAAIRQGAEWKKEGLDLSVTVNLAADNLQDPQFYETLSSILASTGADPGRLTLEVTESAMMAYPDRAKQVLGLLRAVGVRVSIDDFGTGYSSLSYLKELPVDEVKVDKGFIKDVTDVEQAASITRAVIELGHSLGLDVVAKGVEDRPTRDLVAAWGCDTGQGYYFGRALPATEFRNWLRQSAGQPGFAGVERRAIPAGLNSLLRETGR
jgi:predicted signal transduction protein with EAL and GGDEF domain